MSKCMRAFLFAYFALIVVSALEQLAEPSAAVDSLDLSKERLKSSSASSHSDCSSAQGMMRLPFTIIGFSKGSVVLNQLVTELDQDYRAFQKTMAKPRAPHLRHHSGKWSKTLVRSGSSTDDDSVNGTALSARPSGLSKVTTEDGRRTPGSAISVDGANLKRQVLSATQLQTASNAPSAKALMQRAKSDGSLSSVDVTWPSWPWNAMVNFIWLDGGHSGSKNYWLTDDKVVASLVATGRHVEVHTTPYQVRECWCFLRLVQLVFHSVALLSADSWAGL